MSRSVRTRRRRVAQPRRGQDRVGSPPPGPPAPPIDLTIDRPMTSGQDRAAAATPTIEEDRESGPGASLRWSRAAAGLLARIPLLRRLEGRLAPVIDHGRLDRADALAGLLRYGVMGGLATGVYFALAVGLHQTGLGPNTTSAIAIAVSVVVSFIVQSRVTFQTGRLDAREAARFVVVGLIGLTVSRVVIGTVHLGAGQPFWVAALVVCLVVPITNFTAMNFWVFTGGRRKTKD